MRDFWLKVRKTLAHGLGRAVHGARARWWALGRRPAERPVFVVGCSRAGTTLVYKTLSESRALGSLQRETHDFWTGLHPPAERGWASHAIGPEQASAEDRETVSRYFFAHTGRSRFVDKNNQNGLSVAYLHALFPDAYFVHVARSPGDNINSLIEGWGRAEEFATWSKALPAQVAVDEGRYTRWCFFLAEGWREYLEAPVEEVCAFQYRAMNQAILRSREAIPADRWVTLRYEDLVRSPGNGFRRAFQTLGLDFDQPIAEHCAAVLSNPYNAFSEIRLDKWRDGPHRAKIERVLPQVEEVARRMGYAT